MFACSQLETTPLSLLANSPHLIELTNLLWGSAHNPTTLSVQTLQNSCEEKETAFVSSKTWRDEETLFEIIISEVETRCSLPTKFSYSIPSQVIVDVFLSIIYFNLGNHFGSTLRDIFGIFKQYAVCMTHLPNYIKVVNRTLRSHMLSLLIAMLSTRQTFHCSTVAIGILASSFNKSFVKKYSKIAWIA